MTAVDLLPDFETRVAEVFRANRVRELVWSGLTALLFLVGIAGIVSALWDGEYLWTIPSGVVAVFLKDPLRQLWRVRQENVALSLAPALIRELPPEGAAMNIQRMLDKLYPTRDE